MFEGFPFFGAKILVFRHKKPAHPFNLRFPRNLVMTFDTLVVLWGGTGSLLCKFGLEKKSLSYHYILAQDFLANLEFAVSRFFKKKHGIDWSISSKHWILANNFWILMGKWCYHFARSKCHTYFVPSKNVTFQEVGFQSVNSTNVWVSYSWLCWPQDACINQKVIWVLRWLLVYYLRNPYSQGTITSSTFAYIKYSGWSILPLLYWTLTSPTPKNPLDQSTYSTKKQLFQVATSSLNSSPFFSNKRSEVP